MELRAWTDAAIPELGDVESRAAPIREATIVAYDGGEQATAIVAGKAVRIGIRFLYARPAREKAPAPVAVFKPARPPSSSAAIDSAYVRIKSSGQNSREVITKRSRRPPRP